MQKGTRCIHEQQVLNVVDDLCHFIMQEVVNVRGKFFTMHRNKQWTLNTFLFMNGSLESTVSLLVAFVGNNRKICIQCAHY